MPEAVIVAAARSPIGRAFKGSLAGIRPDDLAVQLVRAALDQVLSFDMGGTTAKVCLIDSYHPQASRTFEVARVGRFKKGSGLPIKAPVIDMIEIGAGGGSVASVDEVGLLRVGPHSAGADPGPACYGRGGTEPTVTDANLLLGYYDPGFFLGGRMVLDVAAARQALERVGGPLGLSAVDTAWGIHRVVTESMAAAARIQGRVLRWKQFHSV